jgi:hypothetical protein
MKTQSKAKPGIRKKSDSIERAESGESSTPGSSPTVKETSASSRFEGHARTKKLPTSAEEADRRFDEGESVFDLGFDPDKATRPGLEPKRTTLDLPAHLLQKLDHEAAVRGVTRQSLIKMWLFERLTEGGRYQDLRANDLRIRSQVSRMPWDRGRR